MKNYKILFTGGHHNSTLEVIKWLRDNETSKQLEIIWVGKESLADKDGKKTQTPEFIDISPFVTKFYHLDAGKFYRIRSIKYLSLFIISGLKIPIGFVEAFKILLIEKPRLVVSWGGYIALPLVLAAFVLRIKTVTHEQTITLGLANKIIALFTNQIMTAWPIEKYPKSIRKKAIYVGLPIKKILSTERYKFKNSNPVLFITGGKMGSSFINKCVVENISSLTEKYNLVWSYGVNLHLDKKLFEEVHKIVDDINLKGCIISKDYFNAEEMSIVYNSIDFVFSRSGAHSVYEFLVHKKPCLLCPIPWSSQNEQFKNAKIVIEAGIGILMEEDHYSNRIFLESLKKLVNLSELGITHEIKIISNSQEIIGKELLKKIQ